MNGSAPGASHLALTAALTNFRVRAVAAWYPITDIAAIIDGDESFSPWLGGWPSLMPEAVAQASPITHVTAAAPPCLLVHGAADSMAPATQSERLVARMREAGLLWSVGGSRERGTGSRGMPMSLG